MAGPETRGYAFGEFRLDIVRRQLVRGDGTPVALTPKVFKTLLCLVQRSQSVLSKDELMAAVWPGRVVEENNLNQNISTLRRVLGANGVEQRYIVTEPGRGYRFVATVTAIEGDTSGPHAQDDDVLPSSTAEPHDPVSAPPPRVVSSDTHGRNRFVILAGFALLLSAAALWWLYPLFSPPATKAAITKIAVLPFKPLVARDRDEALEMGMTDTLIAKLSNSNRLVVSSLSSVRAFARLDQDPMRAGRQLGVGAVLDGEIQRRGDSVRINARLLEVPRGNALWSTTLESRLGDVFDMQDAIASQVTAALSIKLKGDARRAMNAHYTDNVEAYRLYLIARLRAEKVKPGDLRAAIKFYRQAIELDPAYALAYAGMGEAYRRLPIAGDVAPKEAFPLAKAAAHKALEIDDSIAEAHAVLGWAGFWYDWDWAASEREFRRAIALNSNLAEAHLGYGHLLSNLGRNTEAVVQGRRATELDPLSPLINTIAAGFFASAGQNDQARRLLDRALQIDPNFWIAHLALGNAALSQGRYDVAIQEFSRARLSSEGSLQVMPMLAIALARAGRIVEAKAILKKLLERSRRGYVPPTSIAKIYSALGDKDQTLAWLQRAYEVRDVRLSFVKRDHEWDPVRGDPRFVAIVKRMGLP